MAHADTDVGVSAPRRSLLGAVGTGLLGTLISGSTIARAERQKPTLVFEDQRSDGRTIVIEALAVEVHSRLHVFDTDRNLRSDVVNIEAGDSFENHSVELTKPLTESQELIVSLVSDQDDAVEDRAFITVETGSGVTGIPDSTLVEADPDSGFNYPYFLYAPMQSVDSDPVPLLVQPNNTGAVTDDFTRHLERARSKLNHGSGRYISDSLKVPLLIPVFPRPRSEPVDGTHYIHSLDVTTLKIGSGPLERVDLQLIAMIRDAQRRLADLDYNLKERILLNGFSAAGTFVNRFAAIHPDIVISVTAGGVNGMPLLPLEEAKGQTLPYHIGVADLEELTGEPFDLEAFRDVKQLLYIGELEPGDTIPYNDAWTNRDRAELALEIYGDDIVDTRMRYSKQVYDRMGISSVFRIYEDEGHQPQSRDIAEFHRRVLEGDSIENLQRDLDNVPHLNAAIEYEPEKPLVGERVAFDATSSSVRGHEIASYSWELDGRETATGPLVTHTFEKIGGHNVRLTITDDAGGRYRAVEQIVVESVESKRSTAGSETPTTTVATTEAESPGFGIAAAFTAIEGVVGFQLHRERNA